MPFPSPSRTPSGVRRRSLFASAASAALLAGCAAEPRPDAGRSGPSAVDRARARAARDSRGLLEQYDAVIAAHPALAERLAPLRATVAAHAAAFEDGSPTPSATSRTASAASSGASATASATASASPAVPTREKDALAGLAAAERALADRRAKALPDLPGEPARLLASVAAAGAAHAYLLTERGA
ncbi:hypothetical protein [Streptomyces olivochromogenes]|uniref:hypothetical protein n=1 Tax=Streptomyces olivochromogenes TaxID=1963 RepID=UPI001F15FA60|nr:hypothetical protein [Streptomyces olivochromogenes]MCF3135302.1 hypothetical protein [Streptomyces olivochromogenes]